MTGVPSSAVNKCFIFLYIVVSKLYTAVWQFVQEKKIKQASEMKRKCTLKKQYL